METMLSLKMFSQLKDKDKTIAYKLRKKDAPID